MLSTWELRTALTPVIAVTPVFSPLSPQLDSTQLTLSLQFFGSPALRLWVWGLRLWGPLLSSWALQSWAELCLHSHSWEQVCLNLEAELRSANLCRDLCRAGLKHWGWREATSLRTKVNFKFILQSLGPVMDNMSATVGPLKPGFSSRFC